MGLIKANLAPPSLSPFSMKDIENQAKAILLRAQQQAEQLLAEAQVEGEQLRTAAHAEGLAAGRAEGLALGREQGLKAGREQALNEQRAKLAQLVAGLSAAAGELDASRRQLEAVAVHEVIALAIAIAERVTKQAGRLDPSIAVANVTEALKLVVHASDVRIAIHPTARATLKEALPALRMQWPTLQHVELIDDAALAPGGCRIFTRQGQVDGDLDEQLRRVAADLVPETQSMGGNGGAP